MAATRRHLATLPTGALFLMIACGQRASGDPANEARGVRDGAADVDLSSSGGSTAAGGSAGRDAGSNGGGTSSGGSGVAGSNVGGSSAGSNAGGSGTADSSSGDAAGAGTYPLPPLPPNTISDSVLAQGESLYRTADDLRIAGNWTASFDTYVELMQLLQGAVGPLASSAHRTMARAEHDLGGLSRWRIEKDLVIGLQHYRASVAHCDVGGCDAVAMGSVARVEQFEQELSSMGQPIPPWDPPSY